MPPNDSAVYYTHLIRSRVSFSGIGKFEVDYTQALNRRRFYNQKPKIEKELGLHTD